ncbi:MAG: methylated-DNA--[protein]-cysteine S-methyltransferase [Methylococcaceae bacterium]|nr:methylated-DNA--[protein]-cysteine S-methyltransferase [Methylococcaceae bacterium]
MNDRPSVDWGERAVIATPFGALVLTASTECLLGIELKTEVDELIAPSSPLLEDAARQFEHFFDDPRWQFSLPLRLQGSVYRQTVWRALCAIRPGSVKTYGQLARELASGSRAVAGACRSNDFPIIIPCHRVVAGSGLGGYCGSLSGPFLDIKCWLLRHEGYGTSST